MATGIHLKPLCIGGWVSLLSVGASRNGDFTAQTGGPLGGTPPETAPW